MPTVKSTEAFQGRVFETVRRIQSGQTAFAMREHCRFCAVMANCPMHLDLIEEEKLRDSDHVLANLKQIRAICDAVEKSAFERVASGEAIPGWKLVQKTARSKWAPDAFDKLHSTPGMLRAELVGITEARKLLGSELVDALIVRESSGYTIAPESDKRPAAMVSAGELDDLTGE